MSERKPLPHRRRAGLVALVHARWTSSMADLRAGRPLAECRETAKKTAKQAKKLAKKQAKANRERANPAATCRLDV